MKRIFISLILIMIFLSMATCSSEKEKIIVKNGNIMFSYDLLNSYLPYGTYTIEEDILKMKTDDGEYEYVFEIDGDKLDFHHQI